jgi:PAS domain S-box-containing protein
MNTITTNQFDNRYQASEQRYRYLFENTPICIFVVDVTVTPEIILEVNRRTELVYGYTAAEMVGKLSTYLLPEESLVSAQNIAQLARQGETATAEIVNRHRDGTTFPARAIAALDPADSGRMIVTVEDISTEQEHRTEAQAIEVERLRIAQEIHDGVAQSLAGLRFKSAQWHHQTDAAFPEMRAALQEVQSVLFAAVEDLRRVIFALRPVDLEALGFFPALTQFVDNFGSQNRMMAQLDISGVQVSLPAAYELPLFRMVQEGLNNIRQHASADALWVCVRVETGGSVSLSLRDNGCGFDPRLIANTHSRCFGLRQMRERIIALGGSLDIHSANGQGTELMIHLPRVILKEGNHAADSDIDRR